jgi:hypothetical protein
MGFIGTIRLSLCMGASQSTIMTLGGSSLYLDWAAAISSLLEGG